MKRNKIVSVVLLFLGISLSAQEIPEPDGHSGKPLHPPLDALDIDHMDLDIGVGLAFKDESFVNANNLRLDFAAKHFSLVADMSMSNDQKFAPARAMLPSGNFFGYYFLMNEGGLRFNLWNLSLAAGRFRLYDIVDSPYSLFINSLGHSSNTLNLKYEGPRFIYETRWIELNSRNSVSSPAWDEYHWRQENGASLGGTPVPLDPSHTPRELGFPDRGTNYKIYAVKVKDWRLGFLDAATYTGRSFDLEYFLNPIPQYFIQYIKGTPGRPWTTDSNENNLIGLFWDIDKKDQRYPWAAYAQVLVDDFAVPGVSTNPWKAAWALGGRITTPLGRFGLHHGGALKYTFEPIGSPEGRYSGDDARTAYGYTYYPEAQYYDDENDGKLVSILIEDNMLGYKHGENNIAFQVDYQNSLFKDKPYHFLLTTELEFSITGNSSLANPWHDYTARSEIPDDKKGTRLLDDGALEKRLEWRVNVSRRIGPWGFYAAATLGGLFNKLELAAPDHPSMQEDEHSGVADSIWIWKASDSHEPIIRFSIGAKYTLGIL